MRIDMNKKCSLKQLRSVLRFGAVLLTAAAASVGVQGQVVINEFSAANYTLNVGGGNEPFVEFYNPGPVAVDLAGYFLSDEPGDPTKFEIPAGVSVPAGGYRIVICSSEGEVPGNLFMGGNLQTNFRVVQTLGESIVFSNAAGVVLESYTFGQDWTPNQANHSWSRSVNGGGVWRVSTAPTPGASNGGAMYDGYAPMPVASVQAGHYPGAVSLAWSAPAGYQIRYTLNGYAPTATSTLYAGPINIAATTVVRAACFDPSGAMAPGFIETNTYFIGTDEHTIITVSVSGNGQEDGAWPGGWGGGADEPAHLEFFYPDGTFWCEATGDSNEHGNDSNAYPQKGFDYVTRDQMGYTAALPAPLFHVKDRQSYQRLIFKAAANDNYPSSGGGHIRDAYVQTLSHLADLHLDERTNESCIVYLNGAYWGVYEYREKVDDLDFTDEYYDQPRHFVDFIKTWGGTWVEYGSATDWNNLVNFVTGQDMTVAANYDYVVSVLNEMSLIDYFVLNSYVVCADWLNWNTAWWRGRHPDGDAKRWRYALWDMDNTFGHGANYTGIPNTGAGADPCNPEALGDPGGQGHVPVLNALMENETFWATYINRWADLSNTWFTCETMHAVLDSMILVIEPEMPRHIQRWGGNLAQWQANVQQIHDFIDDRCASSLVSGMESCYDVVPVNFTLLIEGIGSVEVNSVEIGSNAVPFDGTYFLDLPMQLQALTDGPMPFLFWEVVSGDVVLADASNPLLTFNFTGDVTIRAHFAENLDPQSITFQVSPAGAGTISLDGNLLTGLPTTEWVTGGLHSIQAAGIDEWHVFTGWQTTGINIAPSPMAAQGTIFVNQQDTVTATFEIIRHVDLEVRVVPAGSGTVSLEGGQVVVTDFWSGGLEPVGPVDAWAQPQEHWVFDHWESTTTNPTPGPRVEQVIFDVETSDVLVAYFTPIEFALYIPNAFSPNNDGMNDAFLPLGESFDARSYRFRVFNRWGEVVFESDDPSRPWIGEHQGGGHFVPDGLYHYHITVQSVHEGTPKEYTGTVQVIR
jgi:gliding motility-associated-like protein